MLSAFLRAIDPGLGRQVVRLLLLTALTAGALFGAQAQPLADPRVPWFSADSTHFRVHFREGQRAQAEAVARAAERAYPVVTQSLAWKPRTRVEIVVYSEFDIANGFSTPLPYNFMGVFLAPPDEGELLDNSTWLDLLLVHEFTHAVHLDKVRGAPRVLQSIFGNIPWFIPNVFMPVWGLEGVAVLAESDPAAGRGRLRAPLFEAWLRAERKRGFVSLREINANGRRLPVSNQYMYGVYFMEFLRRVHGPQAIGTLLEQYSGNIIFPRLHSAPWGATGQMMDALWEQFIADLTRQVDERAAPIVARPEVLGPALRPPTFDIESLVPNPGGGWLLVTSDGVHGSRLLRVGADGRSERVARVNGGARLSVGADGAVFITQPDVCNTLHYVYDVYRLEGGRLQAWSHCAHLRRAVPADRGLLALQLDAGTTRLVALDSPGATPRVLWQPPAGFELLDLATSPDGRRAALVMRREADWRVIEIDPTQPRAEPKTVVRRRAPLQGLRWGARGLELIATDGGVPNVWRLDGDVLQRLTHAHTGVLNHAGTTAEGGLATAVIAPGGVALHLLPAAEPLQSHVAVADGPPSQIATPAGVPSGTPAPTTPAAPALQPERPYNALRAVYPRSWFPAVTAEGGLTAVGASTGGGDALGWHRYALLAQVETSQKELVGAFEYQFAGSHGIALTRELTPQLWRTVDDKTTTQVYDRRSKAQWLSLFPYTRVQHRAVLGVGAAADVIDRVDLRNDSTTRRRDSRLLAALLEVDTSGGDWASEGPNRGLSGSVLVESHKPLAGGNPSRLDGTMVRADLRAYVPLPLKSVLALRGTEARARGRTQSFALGGATDEWLQFGAVLGDRTLALRGYRGGEEAALVGQNARVVSAEWRVPLADIDRHFMVPALGVNRVSAAFFVEAGGAWNIGDGPQAWRRSVGVEVLAEARLLYALGLQLRLGVAQALDGAEGTRGYLMFGRAF